MRFGNHPINDLKLGRLVMVSNRLPVALTRVDTERWPGMLEKVDFHELLAGASQDFGYILEPVSLTEEEINRYYFGFSNEIIWPLFHDLQTRCNFDPAYWKTYQVVNHKFAEVIAQNAKIEDYIWVHDYQLMLVARELRKMGMENKIGFFLHTPFPPLDIFAKLPWCTLILEALLEYDVVGFQTRRDRNNFAYCVESMLKGLNVDARKQVSTMTTPKREIGIGSFPISIDFRDFARQAASADVVQAAKRLRETIPNQQIVISVDRLDYSKGIPEKLRAFGNARALQRSTR